MLSFNLFSSTVIVALFDHMSRVAADCECGYRVSSSSSQIASLLFTEALQTVTKILAIAEIDLTVITMFDSSECNI